ncbi:MAG: DNA repair exonuclease, partial [Clostridia bacterium]|nr:DNA repair exonuclease [Clostridia bacterium]
MKFVHIADMHFDSPFVNLSDKENLGDLRRLEQRKAFKKVIEYVKDNGVGYLFISGDLYEQKYVKKSTIEYINNLFKEIPETKVFIAPGNHDPFIKSSYYSKFNWNENVKIFGSEIEKIELDDVNVYGFGFDDFYCKNSGVENINIDDEQKLNILVVHGSLNGGTIENSEYNPLSRKMLKEKGFDYVALGHIHKLDYDQEENQNVVYPGSTVSLGFDELGKHGMIVGDLEKDKIDLEFIPLDETEFKLYEMDITEFISKEELIEKINELNFEENNLIEIILIGKRNFEINKYELYKLISNEKIIKIKN